MRLNKITFERAGLRNLCLRRHAPGGGGNKVFGKRFARLLPVRPQRLAFLSARMLRAFVDAHNRE
uniref:Uncharacterized protein n=1 Tax=Oryza sativa subsp. japonica TaxID=39947 RepID=Q6YZC0_ORYSJ|nr:hypothetical protein [Oryza sativa Japonica Group]BAD05757.1 hypothetical protein [Oryza sativa Japonica Group]